MTKQGLAMQRHPSTAVPVPRFLSRSSLWRRFSAFCGRHLNFYRVHLLWFTFVPLIASAIFYASNGPAPENKIAYIDCLYMCVSAICVTGLTTALFVNLTVWQEVILGFLMLIGGISFVSIIVLGIRRQFFKNKFDYLVRHDAEARERVNEVGAAEAAREGREYKAFDAAHGPKRFPFFGSRRYSRSSAGTQTESARATHSGTVDGDRTLTAGQNRRYERKRDGRLRPDMIRRIDDPVRVNEMSNAGWLGGEPISAEPEATAVSYDRQRPREASAGSGEAGGEIAPEESAPSDGEDDVPAGILQTGGEAAPRGAVQIDAGPRALRSATGRQELAVNRTRTIEFREANEPDFRRRANRTQPAHEMQFAAARRRPSRSSMQDHELGPRTLTRTTTIDQTAMESGFGGFPNPLRAAAALAKEKIPYVRNTFGRDGAVPRTTTMLSTHSHPETTLAGTQYDRNGSIKPVSYISFDALVGRNSRFHALTKAQQEELGGIEYRALTLLIKIVICYWAGLQLFAITMLAPYMTYVGRWTTTLRNANPNANPTWFTFFQYISSYSNTGLSLVDASLVPFQQCYFLVFFQGMLILAGNTAYPVLLRFTIWTMSKIAPKRSQTRETLQFLLDHPRRCFIYLFPSHQTWFLVFLLVILNSIDWVAFEVLDIGTPQIEAIPVGTRIFDGLFQAVAVRSAGFAIVNLGAVAPALQLLYVIMMYIAVYPIAVSIRSTNVYEEKSMGVYDEDFDEDDDEVESRFRKSRSATGYIGYHARKQLAFDLWWLALAVWLICIIERGAINSGDLPEVNVFSVIFEVVSAYGNVGLSLGNNTNAASLSYTFSTLAKLIVIAVMIRGRHRGLPVAIDRAVLLPAELERHNDDITTRSSLETIEARARARRGSMASIARSMQDEPTSYVPERTTSRSSSHDDARSQGGAGTIRARDIIREDKVPSAEADVSDEKVATDSTASDATSSTGEKRVEAGVEAHSMQNRDQVGWH